MKIEQFQQVIEIYNTGSINRASQNLYLAQSSLSSSIRALERELGREIFIRTQSGITLTPFGAAFIEHAREILKHVQQIELSCLEGKTDRQPLHLAVAVYYLMFANFPLVQLCNKYKDERFSFNYLEKNRSNIVTTIAAGEAEIGLVMMPSVSKEKWLSLFSAQDIEYFGMTVETPHALVGPHSELYHAGYTTLTPKLLANREMIVFPEDNELFRSINREVFKKYSPASYLNVCDRGTLITMLNQTAGYYLGTHNKKAYSTVEFYSNIKALPVMETDYLYEIGYVKLRGHTLSAIALEYLQMVTEMIA